MLIWGLPELGNFCLPIAVLFLIVPSSPSSSLSCRSVSLDSGKATQVGLSGPLIWFSKGKVDVPRIQLALRKFKKPGIQDSRIFRICINEIYPKTLKP